MLNVGHHTHHAHHVHHSHNTHHVLNVQSTPAIAVVHRGYNVQSTPARVVVHRGYNVQSTPAGVPVCRICRGSGHISKDHSGFGCPSSLRLGSNVGRCELCGKSDHPTCACSSRCHCYGCTTPRNHLTATHVCGKCGGSGHSSRECIHT